MQYPVLEIFNSIQGEGDHMGKPCTFIRLAGCNLACPWCDTKGSWKDSGAPVTQMTEQEIADKCVRKYVVITGGEPTLYDLGVLCKAIHSQPDRRIYISVETNGTHVLEADGSKEAPDWVTCSPKPPYYKVNCTPNELKYVVDENFNIEVVPYALLYKGSMNIWLQPQAFDMKNSTAKIVSILNKCSCGNLRAGIQLHKVLEVR